jgi:hypothetical protein
MRTSIRIQSTSKSLTDTPNSIAGKVNNERNSGRNIDLDERRGMADIIANDTILHDID